MTEMPVGPEPIMNNDPAPGAPDIAPPRSSPEIEHERLLFEIAEKAYFNAALTSDPEDWMQAGLLAQQHRNALKKLRASQPAAPTSGEEKWKAVRCDDGVRIEAVTPQPAQCSAEMAIPGEKPGLLDTNPELFNILNNALGTMHYHRLMSALNWNGYQIVRDPAPPAAESSGWHRELIDREPDHGQYANTTTTERLRQFAAYGDTAKGRILAQLALTEIERLNGVAQPSWQPIETAPKDKPIMLCVAGFLPCVGRWWPLDSCWTSFDWEGHFESDEEMSDYVNGCSYEPTHWMPLPAGPSVSSTTCGGAAK